MLVHDAVQVVIVISHFSHELMPENADWFCKEMRSRPEAVRSIKTMRDRFYLLADGQNTSLCC